jgi:hypothetical protein
MALPISLSPKGAVSVYLPDGGWPVTHYANEWKAVFARKEMLLKFITTNHVRLNCKCTEVHQELLQLQITLCELVGARNAGSGIRTTPEDSLDIWLKVSQKRAITIYGVRRQYPLTRYCWQWVTLMTNSEAVSKFIDDHRDQLETKGSCVPREPKRGGVATILCSDNIFRPVAQYRL